MRPMARRVCSLLILALLVLCPVAANAAADFWNEGMYDPELDAAIHATAFLDGAAHSVLAARLPYAPIVTAVVRPVDDETALVYTPLPRPPRAPPLA